MRATWKDLTFLPSDEALRELREQWGWLVPAESTPFMFSAMGDVFYESAAGEVFWLDTGRGAYERVAGSREQFLVVLRDKAEEWLLASLVDELLQKRGLLQPEQCYGFKTMPILGGKYEVSNLKAMSAAAWYGFSGYIHRQISELPDGTHVQFVLDK